MSEKMREDFELWAVGNFPMEADVNGLYQNYLTECVWQAWQASRAALVAELPANCKGMALTVDELRAMLGEIGVTLK